LRHPILGAYERYYRRFDKTYHVLLQLESIVLKDRNLPSVLPLVDINFMAEVGTCLLSAGHDADRLVEPMIMDVARPGEQMLAMNGQWKEQRPADMVMRDTGGLCCSILYGQDARSPIRPETSHVLYVTYAPPGVSPQDVEGHLQKITGLLRLLPMGWVEQEILTA
jgi:DNA/RNA-binding domain of Phe-tRNA-synthetase-like protein